MSDPLAFDYERLRYIELRGDGSKLPAKSWGGYDQDFEAAEHVHTHEEVEMYPSDNWGVVDVEDREHGSFALLIFDLDVHKAPEDFDVDRVGIPSDTLVTRSQNGGFHVYFVISGCDRGGLNESDFEMTAEPGFDIDIRGSAVSHHVVAPADIPGVGGDYEVVNDSELLTYFEPAQAAERVQLDGEPLLEFSPDTSGVDYDFDVPSDPPEDMPTCYHAGLELRRAAPDDHPNTHKVNMLTAACGLAAGYDVEEVAGHFCGEYAPGAGSEESPGAECDPEITKYQVKHIAEGEYAPPSEQTLRDYGILDDGEHCDGECPIDWHGPRGSQPSLDVVDQGEERDAAAEAEAIADEQPAETAETDGGATAASGGAPGPARSFEERVRSAIAEFDDDVIQAKTCRHRIARAFVEAFHFVYPEADVPGWRSTLYVYDDESGIYEPRGEDFIRHRLERAASDFTTNQVVNEIAAKIERMSIARGEAFETPPNRLVVGNGILDLHTGELEPFTPDEYHRTKLDVDWNPDAGEPEAIDEFLHDIVEPGDVPTLYRLIAHTLYKEYVGEKAAILIGSGSNGKSMFMSLVEEFVGGHNIARRELQDFAEDGFALNNLQGKLANLATEIGEQELEDTTAFKKATGRDRIDAPVKFEKPVSFENFATLMFATNEMPVFGQDNHAIWRRWVYVDFPYTFDADDPGAKDPEPEHVLKRRLFDGEEFEALLLRCQQEIERWYKGEPFFADAMSADEVRDKMKQAAEPVFAFARRCLEATGDDEDVIEKSVVRAAYQAFADEEDLPRIAANKFGQRLLSLRDYRIEAGQKRVDGTHAQVYKRVRLSSRGRQVLGLDEPEDDGQSQVDEIESNKPKVLRELREMVESNDNEPVPREGVVWRCTGDMTKNAAEHALDELAKQGDVVEMDGGYLPTKSQFTFLSRGGRR